jgi:transcriptional regulator with XRE-family HTH domain
MGFGERLRALREQKELSQHGLGVLVSVHQVMISQMENNDRKPSFDLLVRLAAVLGVSLDELVHGAAPVQTEQVAQ